MVDVRQRVELAAVCRPHAQRERASPVLIGQQQQQKCLIVCVNENEFAGRGVLQQTHARHTQVERSRRPRTDQARSDLLPRARLRPHVRVHLQRCQVDWQGRLRHGHSSIHHTSIPTHTRSHAQRLGQRNLLFPHAVVRQAQRLRMLEGKQSKSNHLFFTFNQNNNICVCVAWCGVIGHIF